MTQPEKAEGYEERAQFYWNELSYAEKEQIQASIQGRDLKNIEAEQALLGAVLVNNQAFQLIPATLLPEHFFEPIHQLIFADIAASIRSGRVANPVTLAAQYEADESLEDIGGKKYLASLASSAVAIINVVEYAEVIFEMATRRKLNKMLDDLRKAICTPDGLRVPITETKHRFMDYLMDLGDASSSKRITPIEEVTRQVIVDVDEKVTADPTGLRCLDTVLEGGFIRRKMYALSAKAKKGKTMLMTTVFYNLMQHYQAEYETNLAFHREGRAPMPRKRQVLYICAEMGQKEIHQRIMGRKMGYNSSAFYTKQTDHDFVDALLDYQRDHQGSVGLMYDARGLRFDELRHILMVAVRRHNIAGFFLDYFGLVRPAPGKNYRSKVDFEEELADWITAFCKDNNVWCCTAQQINRDGKVRGGDALPMYVDAHLELDRSERDNTAWITNRAIRYTDRRSAGTRDNPALFMRKEGPHFVDYDDKDDKYENRNYHEYEPEQISF